MTAMIASKARGSRWLFWSTRSSINNGIPSVTAIVETVIAITVYWYIAIRFETYLPLIVSAAVAPLVLLRSRRSVRLGLLLFQSFEKNTWDKETLILKLPFAEKALLLTATLLIIACSIIPMALLERYLLTGVGNWSAFWYGVLIGWLSLAGISAALVAFGSSKNHILDTTIASVLALIIIAGITLQTADTVTTALFVGAGTALLFGLFTLSLKLSVDFEENLIIPLMLMIAAFPFSLGIPLGVYFVSLTIRIVATLRCIHAGVRTLPQNFRNLVLCTSRFRNQS